jgi:hypothetical protein
VVTNHNNIHSHAHATIGHGQNFCSFPVVSQPWPTTNTKAPTKNRSRSAIEITLTKDGVLSENGPPAAVDDDELTRSQYLTLEVADEILLLALRKARGPGPNNPPVRTRPHSENVAAPNSGRAKSRPQVCDELLRPIARIPPLPLACRCGVGRRFPILLWLKKMSRAPGSTPARAAQGMATTSCCGKFLPDRGQKISCRFSLIA